MPEQPRIEHNNLNQIMPSPIPTININRAPLSNPENYREGLIGHTNSINNFRSYYDVPLPFSPTYIPPENLSIDIARIHRSGQDDSIPQIDNKNFEKDE